MSILSKVKTGLAPRAQRVVIYAPEGFGKSTLAAQFPEPLFLDVEDSTSQLDVARLTREDIPDLPTFEAALKEISKGKPCKTIVVDTIDWLEEMAVADVVKNDDPKWKSKSIEDVGGGYGKGYMTLANRFNVVLSRLDEVIAAGINVVLLAHASIVRFDPPDGQGAYDRYELKLFKDRKGGKGTASLIKEWADLVIFGNWKVQIAEKTTGSQTTLKGVGGRERQMNCNRASAWDAKNRHGLKDLESWDIQVFKDAFLRVGAPWDKEVVMATAAKAVETLKAEAVKPAKAPATTKPRRQEIGNGEDPEIGGGEFGKVVTLGNGPAATVAAPVTDSPSIAPDAASAASAGSTPLPVTASPSEPARELPRSADPIPGIEQDEDEDPELAALIGPQEAVVNAYIRGKSLVKVDQTYRSLSPVERGRILKNFNGFLKVAVAAAGKGAA